MSKKFQYKLLISIILVFIASIIIGNIQLAMIVARLDKMEMENKETEFLVTRTYNRVI